MQEVRYAHTYRGIKAPVANCLKLAHLSVSSIQLSFAAQAASNLRSKRSMFGRE
jgi:hypothetical protein